MRRLDLADPDSVRQLAAALVAEERSLVAHPGMATTPMHQGLHSRTERLLMPVMTLLFARPAEQGALPTSYAAAAPEAPTGLFIGPTGPERASEVHAEPFVGRGADDAVAARLSSTTEDLTGVRYLDPVQRQDVAGH